jgi:hypothetical protein
MSLLTRIAAKAKSLRRSASARVWHPDWLPPGTVLSSEAEVHPHDPIERANLFLAYNTGSTEIEALNWLHSTILLLKPSSVLETGAADGLGTLALASACRHNGFGTVHSVEIDSGVCSKARKLLERAGLNAWVEYHCEDSRRFLRQTSACFEFAFFDSLCELRAEECGICMQRGILRGPAVFHDTSPHRARTMKEWPSPSLHAKFRKDIGELAERYFSGNFCESTLSRGLTILLPRTYPVATK